jgi:hypothetical protein
MSGSAQRLSQPRPQVEAPRRPRPIGGDPDKVGSAATEKG